MPYVINTSLLAFRLQSAVHANKSERCDTEIRRYTFMERWHGKKMPLTSSESNVCILVCMIKSASPCLSRCKNEV